MIHILSWTTKTHQKTLSRALQTKLKKIQGLFKGLHRNLRTFQGKWNLRTCQGLHLKFKDFSRLCEPCLAIFGGGGAYSSHCGILIFTTTQEA